MIAFHSLKGDESNIEYLFANTSSETWSELRERFSFFKFNSICEKDRTWNKFVSTFSKLEESSNSDVS